MIAHVDLDCFYTQVEVHQSPELRGKPVVVTQYNPWGDLKALRADESRLFPTSNGSIIAVSYEARASGVKRCERMWVPAVAPALRPRHGSRAALRPCTDLQAAPALGC